MKETSLSNQPRQDNLLTLVKNFLTMTSDCQNIQDMKERLYIGTPEILHLLLTKKFSLTEIITFKHDKQKREMKLQSAALDLLILALERFIVCQV
jgi:hypothetical protein